MIGLCTDRGFIPVLLRRVPSRTYGTHPMPGAGTGQIARTTTKPSATTVATATNRGRTLVAAAVKQSWQTEREGWQSVVFVIVLLLVIPTNRDSGDHSVLSERKVVVLHELENNPCIVGAFLSPQKPCHGGVASITAVVRYTLFLYVFVDGVENASQGHGPGHFASGEVK